VHIGDKLQYLAAEMEAAEAKVEMMKAVAWQIGQALAEVRRNTGSELLLVLQSQVGAESLPCCTLYNVHQ